MRATGFTRRALRLAVLGAVAAGVLGIAPARGAPGTHPDVPHVDQRVTMRRADPPPAPPKGLATNGTGDTATSRMGVATVSATTQACPSTGKNESRLGLMNHTGMYAHCDYP